MPAARLLAASEIPAGLQYHPVDPTAAEQQAIQYVEAAGQATYDPAECKDPAVHAQSELQQTRLAGQGFAASGEGGAVYTVTLLPGDVKVASFTAAATGKCSAVTVTQGQNGLRKQSREEPLPAGAGAQGTVLTTTGTPLVGGSPGTEASTVAAYFTVNATTAIVTAAAPAGAQPDRAAFDALVRATAEKAAAH